MTKDKLIHMKNLLRQLKVNDLNGVYSDLYVVVDEYIQKQEKKVKTVSETQSEGE